MKKPCPLHSADLLGFSRLAVDGTARLTGLVEAMHRNIAAAPGTTGVVYDSIRAITEWVGDGADAMLGALIPVLGESRPAPEREAVLAALNGVMGDHLAATHNPLAVSMRLRRKGRPLILEKGALSTAIPHPRRKLVVLIHGLCMNDRQWTRKRHNHGTALERDLGYTAIHLHYNSGLHISANGRACAGQIELLLGQWPVPLEGFAMVAHSMGGLVARSACHYGTASGHRWPSRLGNLVFLGTPHHGAPLERLGNLAETALQLSPYTSPLALLGRIRSAGITDLRYGNLLDEDWEGRDRFAPTGDQRRPVPLPQNVQCHAIAGITAGECAGLPGDGVVPLDSALGRHPEPGRSLSFAESRQWTGPGMNHWDLLHRPEVYRQIARWLG